MIKLIIDGVEVEVAEGATVLDAADAAGVAIPTGCFHGVPVGACGICCVEVEGEIVSSCNTPASEGMVVLTASERATAQRAERMAAGKPE